VLTSSRLLLGTTIIATLVLIRCASPSVCVRISDCDDGMTCVKGSCFATAPSTDADAASGDDASVDASASDASTTADGEAPTPADAADDAGDGGSPADADVADAADASDG